MEQRHICDDLWLTTDHHEGHQRPQRFTHGEAAEVRPVALALLPKSEAARNRKDS